MIDKPKETNYTRILVVCYLFLVLGTLIGMNLQGLIDRPGLLHYQEELRTTQGKLGYYEYQYQLLTGNNSSLDQDIIDAPYQGVAPGQIRMRR